jgi:triosephosphate isomerase
MNLSRAESVELATALVGEFGQPPAGVEIAICPPSVYLDAVSACLRDSAIGLGAQNMYHREPGAFTGEICAAMLQDVGCGYVILGHSERRTLMGETDEMVNRKAVAALAAGLVPVICVGESLRQREAGQTRDVVKRQFEGSLENLDAAQTSQLVLAYEPVWAIGTGQVATPGQAEEVHADLRNLLAKRYNSEVADRVRILYGGSVKPDNAAELLARPDIDGALVGGASLQAGSFGGIIRAASEIAGQVA